MLHILLEVTATLPLVAAYVALGQNPMQQALQELGRIAKTLHILEYVDDPALRRRVLIGLNKGEHLHSLARNLAFGRQGRFHDRGYEAQLNRASALSLVINAIAVWNTRYFERAEAKLTRQQIPLPEEVWQHLSRSSGPIFISMGRIILRDSHSKTIFVLYGNIKGRAHTSLQGLKTVKRKPLFHKEQRRDLFRFNSLSSLKGNKCKCGN